MSVYCRRGNSALPYMNRGASGVALSARSQRSNLTTSTYINNYVVISGRKKFVTFTKKQAVQYMSNCVHIQIIFGALVC